MSTTPTSQKPDRNLALELVRVTEAAALAAARMVGRGDKEGADQAAVDAMRLVLDSVSMDGMVVIGEGEKDEAPMLYNGEQIGDGTPPKVDIAVDPLEGTRLTALGMPSALAVIALSERGSMFDPGPCVYMEKIAGGPDIADLLDLDRPLAETLALVAERRNRDIRDVMVVMLDRERHQDAMRQVREAGARVRLITDGDVSASLLAVSDNSPVDLLWGIGGTPEGVISAAAIKCIGGQLLGRLWPRNDEERTAAVAGRLQPRQDPDLRRPRPGRERVLLGHRRHRRRRAPGRPLPGRPRRDHRVAGHAVALGHRAPHPRPPRPGQDARDGHHVLRLIGRDAGSAGSAGAAAAGATAAPQSAMSGWSASCPTLERARSSLASERRKAWVTSTWTADWVISYTGSEKPTAIDG